MNRQNGRWLGTVLCGSAAVMLAWGAVRPMPQARGQAGADRPASAAHHAASAAGAAATLDAIVLDAAAGTGLSPAPLTDDAAFLRRVTVDLIARIPTVAEYEAFFADPSEVRRQRLIDRLLSDPRFVERWAMFFGDMLNIRSGADGGGQFHSFIRRSIREATPYDQMVRQMITATGSLRDNAPVGFYTGVNADPLEVTGILTQTLMGVRMQCAQCHDHPNDVWTQRDYYSLAAYFGSTDIRRNERLGLYVVDTTGNSILWPPRPRPGRAQQPVDPAWPIAQATGQEAGLADAIARLDQQQQRRAEEQALADLFAGIERVDPVKPQQDRLIDGSQRLIGDMIDSQRVASKREAFAGLVTDPTNRYFGWNLSNRVWAELMGRGIVEPIDDIRADNPASHPELLDHLAQELLGSNYDLRHLIAVIVTSDAYQRARLEGVPAQQREPIEKAFLASPLRRMNAESLYDSIRLAGHVGQPKHSPGRNTRELTLRIRVAVPIEPEEPAPGSESAPAQDIMADPDALGEMMTTVMVDDPFGSESGIDVAALLDQLSMRADDPLAGSRVFEVNPDDVDPATIAAREAAQALAREAAAARPRRYETRTITRVIDDNPRFDSAFAVRAPAPPEHFLRQFGQTSRVILGEKRDTAANTRQALLLLNGKLTNEAARVGDLEPIYRLMHRDIPARRAVERVYLECLTREPSADELADALAMFAAYDDRTEAVADLRWAIFNSHEFRHLP